MSSITDSTGADGILALGPISSPFETALGQYSDSIRTDVVKKRRWVYQNRDDASVFPETQDHLGLARAALTDLRAQSDPAVLRDRARSVFLLNVFNAVTDMIYRKDTINKHSPMCSPEEEDYGIMLGMLCGWTDSPRPTKFMSSKRHQWTSANTQPAPKSKWPPRYGIVLSYWHYIAQMTMPQSAEFFSSYKQQISEEFFNSNMPESYQCFDEAYKYVVEIWKDSVGLTQPYDVWKINETPARRVIVEAVADSFWDCYFDFLFLVLLNTSLCQIFSTNRAPKILPAGTDGFAILADIGMGSFTHESSMFTYNTSRSPTSNSVASVKIQSIEELARETWWAYANH